MMNKKTFRKFLFFCVPLAFFILVSCTSTVGSNSDGNIDNTKNDKDNKDSGDGNTDGDENTGGGSGPRDCFYEYTLGDEPACQIDSVHHTYTNTDLSLSESESENRLNIFFSGFSPPDLENYDDNGRLQNGWWDEKETKVNATTKIGPTPGNEDGYTGYDYYTLRGTVAIYGLDGDLTATGDNATAFTINDDTVITASSLTALPDEGVTALHLAGAYVYSVIPLGSITTANSGEVLTIYLGCVNQYTVSLGATLTLNCYLGKDGVDKNKLVAGDKFQGSFSGSFKLGAVMVSPYHESLPLTLADLQGATLAPLGGRVKITVSVNYEVTALPTP